MANMNHTPEQPQKEPRFSQEQYDLLRRCSEKRDSTEWNHYRAKHAGVEILLEGADLIGAHLEGANLKGVHLKGAFLKSAHLKGAKLHTADLRSTRAHAAHVDASTLITDCNIDRKTDFSLVGLDSARIDPGLKGLLEYNIRRKAWEKWYWEGCDLRSPETVPPWQRYPRQLVRLFWWASDYGRSTKRVIYSFFILSVLFAALYVALACVAPPGPVLNLLTSEVPRGTEAVIVPVPGWLVPFRALYFSIVTMTTLGFGDMYAHPESLVGHVLLTIQVILGYVLLGALVTRLNILFTTGGPTPRFADEIPLRKRIAAFFKRDPVDPPEEATTDDKPSV